MSLREVAARPTWSTSSDVLARVRETSQSAWRVLGWPVTVYVLTRGLDALMILVAARDQVTQLDASVGLTSHGPASTVPGYSGAVLNWDGHWYQRIAREGYPRTLPIGTDGKVDQNAWAFFPAYPMLVRGAMALTGLSFAGVAPLLSVLLGLAAAVVMYVLLMQTAGRRVARRTVLLFCCFMAAPVLQVAYSESLAVLLVCCVLLLLVRRRYGRVALLLVALALTRPVVLAMAPVVLAHGAARFRNRDKGPFPTRQRWAVVALAALAAALTGLWPGIAALVTGVPDAYLRSESGWGAYRAMRIGTGWVEDLWRAAGPTGLAMLLIALLMAAIIVFRRDARAWGTEVRTWAISYPIYLLTFTTAGTSVVRFLLLAFPLMWPLPQQETTKERHLHRLMLGVLVIAGLLTQWAWVRDFLVISGPPAGRAYP